jgi:hypothetical protein
MLMQLTNASDTVKVLFPLERDEDGYPPVDVEGIWSVKGDENLWRIQNIPFFVKDVSYDDVVEVERRDDELWFRSVAHKSLYSTIRLIVYDTHKEQLSPILIRLEGFGCSWEQSHLPLLVAIGIPPDADINLVFDYLDTLEEQEIATFEVGSLRHT